MSQRRLKGLAWDDEVDGWMTTFDRALRRLEIEIKITNDADAFLEEFKNGYWDFVVLDIYQKGKTAGSQEPAGLLLAENISNTPTGRFIPIFLITQVWRELGKDIRLLPENVHLLSKNAGHPSVAMEISHKLNSPLFKDPKRVFVVHGEALDWLEEVNSLVQSVGLSPEVLESDGRRLEALIRKRETHPQVGCAIVLVASDGPSSASHSSSAQRTPDSVPFELAYFYGAFGPQRLVLLAKGEGVQWPSILPGVTLVETDTTGKWKSRLIDELQRTGLHVQRPTSVEQARPADPRSRFEFALEKWKVYVTSENLRQPRCFISYAAGNEDQGNWIEHTLATDLKKAGIEVILDRWHNSDPGSSIPRFVDRAASADRIVVVGTPLYLEKCKNLQSRGFIAAAEWDLISKRMTGTEAEKNSVVPVLLEGIDQDAFPPLLHRRVFADFRNREKYFETMFNLIRALYAVTPDNARWVQLRASLSSV